MQQRESSAYFPLLLAGLIGASAGSVLMTRGSGKEEPRPAPAPRSPRVDDTTEATAEAVWLGRVRPALELVADHLGLSRRPGERDRQAALLAAHWRATAESGDPRLAEAARRAADEIEKEHDPLERPLKAFVGPASAAVLEKDSFLWRDRKELVEREVEQHRAFALLEAVMKGVADKGLKLEVVIATVPDYVDSYSAWTFDQLVDVLQRAAGASGLVIDRFHLPDWQPEGAEAARSGPARTPRHEIEPAAVLFRSNPKTGSSVEEPEPGRLVLLLLPLETATSGVHKAAFLGAVGLANEVAGRFSPGRGVTVLGPTFSGSTPSLVLALEEAFERGIVDCVGPRPFVRFISGAATDLANKERLQGVAGCGEGAVSFAATVASDDQALAALRSFFRSSNMAWASGRQMAILTESNSGWGQALTTGLSTPDHISPDACQRGLSDDELRATQDPFPCAKHLTFPLHVSRLRGQAARAGGQAAAVAGGSVASLRSEDKALPTDQLPALRPELSAAMVETALATTFGALDRVDITAIGIIGSDARDLLFLAEQIRRRKPNVLLFTLEGSLAFLHPDYRPFARGMVVASSYPLFSMTQQLLPSPPREVPIQQFPNMGGQGLYNAFLAAVGEYDRLLDYGTRCGSVDTCRPSIWISQVGNNAIWPLRRSEPEDDGYTWRPELGSPGQGNEAASAADAVAPYVIRAKATWPFAAGVGFLATALAVFMHVWILRRAVGPTPARRWPGRLGFFETPGDAWSRWGLPADNERLARLREEHGIGLLACWGALLVLVFLGIHLAAVGVNTGATGPSPVLFYTAAILRWSLLAAFVAAAVRLLALSNWDVDGLWRLVRLTGVVLGAVGLFCLSWSLTEGEVWRDPLAGSTVQRYLMFKSLLSPVAPLLLLCAAVYGWGLWNLWRLHHQIAPHGRDCAVVSLLQGDNRETAERLQAVLDEPFLQLRGREALGILVIVAVQLTASWRHFRTTDGVFMGYALLAGTLLATLLAAHVVAYCYGTGRTLLRALAALNRHPIGSGFARLGREPFLWRLSEGAPTSDQAAPLFRLAEVNASSFSRLLSRLRDKAQQQGADRVYTGQEHRAHRLASGETTYEVSVDRGRAAQIAALQIRGVDIQRLEETRERLEHAARDEDGRPLQASSLWREVASWSQPLLLAMRKVWQRDPYGFAPLGKGKGEGGGLPRHLQEAETLLALQASFAIRQVVIRLTRGVAFGVAALVLVLFAHLSYLFQGRAFWLGLDWALLGIASLLGLSLFVRMEKDPVLSRLWGTPPGHLSLNGQFVQRIIMYGAIPVVTLFVTFFPEVGQALFSWLEPLQKSLP